MTQDVKTTVNNRTAVTLMSQSLDSFYPTDQWVEALRWMSHSVRLHRKLQIYKAWVSQPSLLQLTPQVGRIIKTLPVYVTSRYSTVIPQTGVQIVPMTVTTNANITPSLQWMPQPS